MKASPQTIAALIAVSIALIDANPRKDRRKRVIEAALYCGAMFAIVMVFGAAIQASDAAAVARLV